MILSLGTEIICSQATVLSLRPVSTALTKTLVGSLSLACVVLLDIKTKLKIGECLLHSSFEMQIPILFLTAKDEELDVVRGLDAGGNDYVTKPFRMQELLSRIRALLRRSQKETTINRSGITLDIAKLQASKDGEVLLLTVTEYKILAKLISERSIITRAALLDALWDVDSRFVDDNTLSVHVSRLREKVGSSHIKTIRGVGYQWVD